MQMEQEAIPNIPEIVKVLVVKNGRNQETVVSLLLLGRRDRREDACIHLRQQLLELLVLLVKCSNPTPLFN